MAKKTFDAAAAWNAPSDDDSMGQDSAPAAGADGGAAGSGQPVTFPPEQVAQMEQLKQAGDMAGLGQYVAQFLP